MRVEVLKHIYFRLPVLVRLFLTVLLVMIFFGIIIHFTEPNEFPTIFDGVWWAFVTGATVGYGDYAPLTKTGRIIGILLMLTGGGLITFYITIFAAATVKHERDLSKGKVAFKGKNHTIFIGWNERTRQLIDLTLKTQPKTDIVLIDQTLNYLAYQAKPIHFIHGDCTDDVILKKANIKEAAHIVITADISLPERQADNYTILATVAIKGNNSNLPIIVEILSKKQIENALRAGATTIVRPNDFMSTLLYHELFRDHTAKPFESVLCLLTEQQFKHISLPDDLDQKPFIHVSQHFLQRNHLLLGIIRDNEYKIHPSANFQLKKKDILITLIPWSQ